MHNHKSFSPAPSFGQVAINGIWENALAFLPGETLNKAKVLDYLSDNTEVAFEAFFGTKIGSPFFGMRRNDNQDSLASFVIQLANAITVSKSGSEFFSFIQKNTGVALGQDFQFAEVGAINAWKSTGPFKIREPREFKDNFETFWPELLTSPVGKNTTHPKALELSYSNGDGTNHWFGFLISEEAAPFELDREKILDVLGEYHSTSN